MAGRQVRAKWPAGFQIISLSAAFTHSPVTRSPVTHSLVTTLPPTSLIHPTASLRLSARLPLSHSLTDRPTLWSVTCGLHFLPPPSPQPLGQAKSSISISLNHGQPLFILYISTSAAFTKPCFNGYTRALSFWTVHVHYAAALCD